jgi:hypothetical protein
MGPEQKRRNPMIRTIRLFVLIAVAISLPSLLSAKGKPTPNTEKCTIDGELSSDGQVVVIGKNLRYEVVYEDGTTLACVYVHKDLLDAAIQSNLDQLVSDYDSGCGPRNGYYAFHGNMAFWLGQGNSGGLDFCFGPQHCEVPQLSTNYEDCVDCDSFPFWIDDLDPFCPYHLIFRNGSYDKATNTLTFDGTKTELYDGTLGYIEGGDDLGFCHADNINSCDPINCQQGPDSNAAECSDCNCFNNYEVSDGPLGGYIEVQFGDGSGGSEPTGTEKGSQCRDSVDNDSDGDTDCDDPDCYNDKWCR